MWVGTEFLLNSRAATAAAAHASVPPGHALLAAVSCRAGAGGSKYPLFEACNDDNDNAAACANINNANPLPLTRLCELQARQLSMKASLAELNFTDGDILVRCVLLCLYCECF
jgi:hypothetical protein